KVLPLCFEEIQRCRPYFIGLLGERYGCINGLNSIDANLLESQSWLYECSNNSVTELEILFGVFNNEVIKGNAFIYFRDPGYIHLLPDDVRKNYTAENNEDAL